jgi:hypothetical protein
VRHMGERGFRRWYEIHTNVGYARYICLLTNEYNTTYIRRLIDECMVLCSSVEPIFLGSGTEEYKIVIFLGNEEYKTPRNVSCFPVVRGFDLFHRMRRLMWNWKLQ